MYLCIYVNNVNFIRTHKYIYMQETARRNCIHMVIKNALYSKLVIVLPTSYILLVKNKTNGSGTF